MLGFTIPPGAYPVTNVDDAVGSLLIRVAVVTVGWSFIVGFGNGGGPGCWPAA